MLSKLVEYVFIYLPISRIMKKMIQIHRGFFDDKKDGA